MNNTYSTVFSFLPKSHNPHAHTLAHTLPYPPSSYNLLSLSTYLTTPTQRSMKFWAGLLLGNMVLAEARRVQATSLQGDDDGGVGKKPV